MYRLSRLLKRAAVETVPVGRYWYLLRTGAFGDSLRQRRLGPYRARTFLTGSGMTRPSP